MKTTLQSLLMFLCMLVGTSALFAQNAPFVGSYNVTGYAFRSTADAYIGVQKSLNYLGIDPATGFPKYYVDYGLLGDSYQFSFEVDSSNRLTNWQTFVGLPAPPAGGFMTADNPGKTTIYPDTTHGYVSSTYNNTYNPVTRTFYMHYGYSTTGGAGQNTFDRQVYEKWVFTGTGISSFSPVNATQGTLLTIKGIGFTGATSVFFSSDSIAPQSFTVVNDSVITAVVGKGASGSINITTPNSTVVSSTTLVYTAPYVANPRFIYTGAKGFSAGGAGSVSIAFGPSKLPYVVYVDRANGRKASVMKLGANNTWTSVGGAASDGACTSTNIVVDKTNTPYIAYLDSAEGNGITVKKFNGTTWVTLGARGFAPMLGYQLGVSMALDSSNNPYVLSINGTLSNNVMKFNGTSWVQVGAAALQSLYGGGPA